MHSDEKLAGLHSQDSAGRLPPLRILEKQTLKLPFRNWAVPQAQNRAILVDPALDKAREILNLKESRGDDGIEEITTTYLANINNAEMYEEVNTIQLKDPFVPLRILRQACESELEEKYCISGQELGKRLMMCCRPGKNLTVPVEESEEAIGCKEYIASVPSPLIQA